VRLGGCLIVFCQVRVEAMGMKRRLKSDATAFEVMNVPIVLMPEALKHLEPVPIRKGEVAEFAAEDAAGPTVRWRGKLYCLVGRSAWDSAEEVA